MRKTGITLMGLLAILFGCGTHRSPILPAILSESEGDGFVDMVFAVTERQAQPSGDFTIDMAAKTDDGEVACRVILGTEWKKGTLDGKITTYQGVVTLTRIDDRSDRLIQFMDKAYVTRINPKRMKNSIRFTGISLEGDPTKPLLQPMKIKLFFESEDEKEYAEAFLNLDLVSGKGWFNEKDQAYRSALIYDIMNRVGEPTDAASPTHGPSGS